MNWNEISSDNVKEKLGFTQQRVVKFLLILILGVTFEHNYTILCFFTSGTTGKLSTVGLVLWLDLMLFFSLSMCQRETSRVKKFFGWLVFIAIVIISGFLNVFYMLRHPQSEFSQIIGQIIAAFVGSVIPLGIVFLGIANSTSQETIAKAQAKRMRTTETKDASEPRPITSPVKIRKEERNKKIMEMVAEGKPKIQIAEAFGITRPTLDKIIKEASPDAVS